MFLKYYNKIKVIKIIVMYNREDVNKIIYILF